MAAQHRAALRDLPPAPGPEASPPEAAAWVWAVAALGAGPRTLARVWPRSAAEAAESATACTAAVEAATARAEAAAEAAESHAQAVDEAKARARWKVEQGSRP